MFSYIRNLIFILLRNLIWNVKFWKYTFYFTQCIKKEELEGNLNIHSKVEKKQYPTFFSYFMLTIFIIQKMCEEISSNVKNIDKKVFEKGSTGEKFDTQQIGTIQSLIDKFDSSLTD